MMDNVNNAILAAECLDACKDKYKRIVTAESCTGGLLSSAIISIPGASQVFDCGFVTYSTTSKAKLLGISLALLETYGACSFETAKAMAIGALERSNADIAISITGEAGPIASDQRSKVGSLYIGWAETTAAGSAYYQLSGDRESICRRAVGLSLELLLRRIHYLG